MRGIAAIGIVSQVEARSKSCRTPSMSHRMTAGETAGPRAIEATLARLSAAEMVDALGWGRAPLAIQTTARAAFSVVSIPLGRVLARFDQHIAARGIAEAAAT